jgi:mannosyltransferase OCH1-like enzyme
MSKSTEQMEYTAVSEEPVYFPAQCSCGHIIFEKYFVKIDENTLRPFTWCGFCRTRKDLKDVKGKNVLTSSLEVASK